MLIFVYSKSEYTTKIGQCVRPAVRPAVRPSVYTITLQKHKRLAWNFVAQNGLNNISVEFEDENDRWRNGWVIVKTLIIDQIIPEGDYRDFQKKNFFILSLLSLIIYYIYRYSQFYEGY